MSATSNTCTCGKCPGPTCTCGCQNATAKAPTAGNCKGACSCGAACTCRRS